MDAFHSFWSKPNISRNRGKVKIADYELLVMILSALKWREMNGSIKMMTDSPGAFFFEANGISGLWDEMDTGLDCIDPDIDPFLFWAAGKLYGLRKMPCPCVMMDTDVIIWKKIDDLLDCDIVAAHYEELTPEVYPDIDTFRMKASYCFPDEWNYGLKAMNTAFLFIRENSFRNYYVESAESFMYGIKDGFNPINAMCFAEQRILPMCADARKMKAKCLLELANAEHQDFITHIWGYKRELEHSYKKKKAFCIRCIGRIITDYPEWESIIAGSRYLSKYYYEYRNARSRK